MNSDLMPSPDSANSFASNEPQTDQEAAASTSIAATQPSQVEKSPVKSNEPDPHENLVDRQQPIPPPSEPMQYRAIGLIRGRYKASDEHFTQGALVTADGVELNSVLLGRIMSLVKNHLDLEKEHLWVVYPRTRQENDSLHIQIVGVWEPESLAKTSEELAIEDQGLTEPTQEINSSLIPSSSIPDGGFSVRGEVVYQSFDTKSLVVKIKQAPRKPNDKPKYFKLKLQGVLTTKAVGKFWDFQAKREADVLVVETAEAIADLPKKRRPPFNKGGGGPRGAGGGRRPFPPRRPGETPRPVKRVIGDSSTVSKPLPKSPSSSSAPVPKPVKRPKPTQE